MPVISNNTLLEVTFGSTLSAQGISDPFNYLLIAEDPSLAVPIAVQSVALRYTTIQSGYGFVVSDYDEGQVARMVGGSALSANAMVTTIAPNASMLGSAGLTASATVAQAAQATMAGVSGLSANPHLPTAVMAGASALAAMPTVQSPIQATMAGSATVIAISPPTTAVLSGGSTFLAELTRVATQFTRLFFPYGYTFPILVGDFISLQSAANNVQFAKVIQVYPDGTLGLDRELLLLDPDNGNIVWTHTTGIEGVDLTINKPTNTKTYTLVVTGLRDVAGEPFAYEDSFTAVSSKPQVLSAEQLADGQIVITFSDTMRVDFALLSPNEYEVTGPSLVLVKTVQTVTPHQVMLTTVGMATGAYQVTVNATGTPHDLAGNPMDPVFNQAIFSGSPALSSRSIFVDKGPITKPALTLQTGVSTVIVDAVTLVLNGATVTPAMVGLYVTLTGSSINNGTFRISARLSATKIRVVASFTLPDPSNGVISPPSPGTIAWIIFDPRNGEIADDPSDVTVRINTIPVIPDAVIGLLGQIILSTVPDPTDIVDVDYCWICNPVVDFRRLNSSEFRLNNWNRDTGRPADSTQHKYRYNNTLIQPATFVPLDLLAEVPQPLQRDLKYRAFERAYSTALNDPNLLLLNSPTNRIAFPPMSRPLESSFVNYQATVLPEVEPVTPWERHGTGTAMILGTDLVVIDTTSGAFPIGNPIFWTRDIDLTFQHVFASAWRMMVDAVPTLNGVWTGIASGYSDNNKAVVIGYLFDASEPVVSNRRKLGILKAGEGNDPSLITSWTGGIDSLGSPTGLPMVLDWSVLRSYRIFRDRTGIVRCYIDGSIVESLRALPEDLPYLEELNDPFNQLQGVFFGSLSREALNTSTWSFVRYTAIPINPLQAAPSVFVSYEGTTPPEEASQPWTPVGFHGTETIISSEYLLLDSTSATNPESIIQTGATGTVLDYTTLSLPSALATVAEVGMSIRLAGTAVNAGVYVITEVLTPTSIRVLATLDAYDAANGSILWQIFNPYVAGLVSGDFKGFSRIEPLLAESFDTILDINVTLRTFTHGITPNANLAAIDDGDRLIQLCFFPDQPAPKFSYGGRSVPELFTPYLWNKIGGADASMVGQFLKITDSSTTDGLVYFLDDTNLLASPERVVGSGTDYILEFRTLVVSYVPDMVGYAGVTAEVYDSARSVGILLEDIAGVRYVTFHSEGNPIIGGRFAFEWFDNQFHTYRAIKNIGGNLVSLWVDGVLVGSVAYSAFNAPPPSVTGMVSFGSSTPLSIQAKSTVEWAYANFWRVNYGFRKFVGLWKGYDPNALTGYHLPLTALGRGASANGNVLTDSLANFITSGVAVGEQLIVDAGPNRGVYTINSVAVTQVTLSSSFPVQPSVVDYRIVTETDWSTPHRYRILKDPSGGVAVLLDNVVTPIIQVGYNSLDLPPSSSGISRTIAGGLPSILWGAFDPTNISQTSWDYVRFGAVRSISELGIVPHHQVLNQRNVMASFEHHRTNIVHTHTDFWSESEGIPPQTEPDLLRNPNLVAYTLLNDSTPLVPSTQTYEVRSPTAVLVSVVGLNRPEDVLNSQAFVLNSSEQVIRIIVPDDVLYNCLQVIETTTGESGIIAPFSDECSPDFGADWHFQNTVCLTYDGAVLPENDLSAASVWTRSSELEQGTASLSSGSPSLTDGSAQFLTAGVQVGDTVEIQTSVAKGLYSVSAVLSATTLQLTPTPPTVATALYSVTTNSSSAAHQFATAFSGVLTYGTDGVGTRTTYRNNSPLPDSIAMQTEVKFRLKILQDSTGGLGDSQVRVGFSSPGVTIGLGFITTPLGERYVLAIDLNTGLTVGGIPFDFYDGAYHTYKMVRDPGTASIQISIDS